MDHIKSETGVGEEPPLPATDPATPRVKREFDAMIAAEDTNSEVNFVKRRKIARKECTVCAEDVASNQFPKNLYHADANCPDGGDVCFKCWSQSLAAEIESKTWDQIKCMSCAATMQEPEIKRLANRKVYQAWQRKATLSFLSDRQTEGSSEVRITCPLGSCKGAGFIESNSTWFSCDVCETTYCTACQVHMHSGETCEVYRERKAEEDAADAAKAVEVKRRAEEEEASAKIIKRETKAWPQPQMLGRKAAEELWL